MAPLDPTTADHFLSHLGAAQTAVQAGVVPSRSTAADAHWLLWHTFCTSLAVDPLLSNIQVPTPFLQVFAHGYRTGEITPSGNQVRSRTVEDVLRSIGQTFLGLGQSDPRLTSQSRMDFRLQRQLASYTKADPPPNRVKPIPISVIRHILALASANADVSPDTIATADMIALALFFLLRPGEYTGTRSDTTPFRMCDVCFYLGTRRLVTATATEGQILSATYVTLEFTTQKNGVRGEVIGLGCSGSPTLCPIVALSRRVLHLRRNNAPLTTPLATFYNGRQWKNVTPSAITSTLRHAVTFLGPTLGFLAKDVSARSLRASGAMALLCAKVDTDIIRLLGRWRSDEMLRYLHVQAEPIMRDFARRMLNHGDFRLLPNQEVPTL